MASRGRNPRLQEWMDPHASGDLSVKLRALIQHIRSQMRQTVSENSWSVSTAMCTFRWKSTCSLSVRQICFQFSFQTVFSRHPPTINKSPSRQNTYFWFQKPTISRLQNRPMTNYYRWSFWVISQWNLKTHIVIQCDLHVLRTPEVHKEIMGEKKTFNWRTRLRIFTFLGFLQHQSNSVTVVCRFVGRLAAGAAYS